MNTRRTLALCAALSLETLPHSSWAVWPPTPEMTPDDLSRRENQPNDPGFAGQWEMWSFIPAMNLMVPNFRRIETLIGSGNNTDRAWALSTGDPRVLIAVLDSGINWDNTDLINKVAINTGELPMPMGAMAYDMNGDGVANVADYTNDMRISCGSGGRRDPRMCRGGDGMPNDPNRNGVLDAGDLIRVFSDGTDGDRNGYVDDIAGWDFMHDDNDPNDDTRFGHGTGEARDSAAEGNNGQGDIGDCPRCMFVPVRVGDSFITDVGDFAQGTVYAVDRGVNVVQEALGTLDNNDFGTRAIDYAYAHDVIVVASAADENSRHHNMPGTNNHMLYVHAVRYDGANINGSTTFLNFNNCTNFGAQLVLSVAGTGCSSEATGHASGIAGLLYSMALQTGLSPRLSAEEARQLMLETADDINVPESVPDSPMHDETKYPSYPGWDQRFGYGRVQSRRALEWIRDRKIPPEIDIVSPRWFTVFNPDRTEQRVLRLEGRIAARRAPRFDYAIEWAPGVEPTDTQWRMIRSERNVTAAVTDRLGDLDLSTLNINNPGEVENRYTITVRIRATAHYDGAAGDVPAETRRAFYVHRDSTVLPGFPIDVRASGESSPHTADLNGDGRREIVYVTSDGRVHAFQANGTELPGWPAHTLPMVGLDPAGMPNYTNAPAYSGAGRAIDPSVAYEPVIATPGIADLDGNGTLEVVVNGYHGRVYVFNRDGTAYGHGFPFVLPDVPSAMTSPQRILDRGIFGSPVLYDLNRDNRPEIIFGAFDGKLYALNASDASIISGFPVTIHFPGGGAGQEYNRVFGSVGVGEFDGDNRPDLVVVSNEKLEGDSNTGAIYLVYADGTNHAGGPFHPNWPIAYPSFNFFPLVGEGISTSPAIADIDGDGRDELSFTGSGIPSIILARGVQPPHSPRPAVNEIAAQSILRTNNRGQLSDFAGQTLAFASVFSLGTFGDMTNDGQLEYISAGAELRLAINLGGGGRAQPFNHLVNAFTAMDGRVLPGFPRIIEDYVFFMNPIMADLNRDAYPEVILGTGGYYLRAFDGCGREPGGWPKFTGQWIIPSPTLGDLDGDHSMEVVTGTRNGFLWAWRTESDDRTSSVQWETFRHDNQNTGNFRTPTPQGVRRVPNVPALACPAFMPGADAGVNPGDASTPPPAVPGGGCSCHTRQDTSRHTLSLSLFALSVLLFRRRRTRALCPVEVPFEVY